MFVRHNCIFTVTQKINERTQTHIWEDAVLHPSKAIRTRLTPNVIYQRWSISYMRNRKRDAYYKIILQKCI